MTPTPELSRFSSSPTPGTASLMTVAGGRGWATATSVTITPSTGGMIGSIVFCAGSTSHTLYSGSATCTLGAASAVEVHGTIAGGVCVVSSSRHWVQLTRMRLVPSSSGEAEM